MNSGSASNAEGKRVFPRATKNIAAWILIDGEYVRATAVDFGAQGACLEMDVPFPSGQVAVSFELDSNWTVRAEASKIWERQDQGKFFVGITYKTERSSDKSLIGPWIHKMRNAESKKSSAPNSKTTD